jgi:hypothetical protein
MGCMCQCGGDGVYVSEGGGVLGCMCQCGVDVVFASVGGDGVYVSVQG